MNPDASRTMSSNETRAFMPLAFAAALAVGVGAFIYYTTRTPSEVRTPTGDPANAKTGTAETASKTESVPSQTDPKVTPPIPAPPENRKPAVCYLTRKSGTPYQSVQRFEPQRVAMQAVPGYADIDELYARQNKSLPPVVALVEQYSETTADVLGEKTRTLADYKAYLDPSDGRIIAFDLAVTAGGIPQRIVGRLSKNGAAVDMFRGGVRVDHKDVDFPGDTMILPLEMEFIHHSFTQNKGKKLAVGVQTFFVPEVLGFVSMVVTPAGTETIAHRGANHECAKYEVRVEAGRLAEGAFASQQMWFDTKDGALLKRVDFEEGAKADEMPVTERVDADALAGLQPLLIRPPENFPLANPFPYPLEKELVYHIKSRDVPIGTVRVRYSKRDADRTGPAGYQSTAFVEMNTGNGNRTEMAETRYDEKFQPIAYKLEGEEAGDAQARYRLLASFNQGRLRVTQRRDLSPMARDIPAKPAEEEKEPAPVPIPVKAPVNGEWREPLRLVSLEEIEEDPFAAIQQRRQNLDSERALSPGTFFYDFNRVEQLAMALFRLPLPPAAKDAPPEGKAIPAAFQRAAFYAVRKSAGTLVNFVIRPEPRVRPAVDDPEVEQELLKEDVSLTVVTARGTLINGTLLLAPDGRLLQWTEKTGGNDVIFTLDDPIMRTRENNARILRGQEGPTIIRPPWY